MPDNPTLLADTRATVARWPGWRVRAWLEDRVGRWGFLASHDGTAFLCVCKRTLHGGQASFMEKAVDRAHGENYVLAEFVAARYSDGKPTLGSAFAFDAETVARHGRASTGDSVAGRDVDWLQLPVRDYGVFLGEYVSGRAGLVPPEPMRGGQDTLPV